MSQTSFVTPNVTLLSFIPSQVFVFFIKSLKLNQSSRDHHRLSNNSVTKLSYSQESSMWLKPLLPLYCTEDCYPFVTLTHFYKTKAYNLSSTIKSYRKVGTFSNYQQWGHHE